jgi:hypothetical protein
LIRLATLVSLAVASVPVALFAGPAAAQVPSHACKLLKKAEVRELLLGKRIVEVERASDDAQEASRCEWKTGFYQTPKFKKADAPFGLQLDVQSTESAADALEELRSASTDIDSSVDEVDGLGDEAYEHFSDLIVVSGETTFQVGAENFDTAKKPHPDVDTIAREAADLVLTRLDGGQIGTRQLGPNLG